jgi:hypothetical protein
MSIRPTYSTMGQSTPASVAEGTGYYRYNGDQPYVKAAPAGTLPQNAKAITAKQRRIAEFGRLLTEEKLTREQAAERLGISRSTARYYENDLKDQQRREAAP